MSKYGNLIPTFKHLSSGVSNLYPLPEINKSASRTKIMRAMHQANTIKLKAPKSVLLGTSALVCLALAAPVMADDFVITSSDGSTNGVGTTNGTAGAIAAGAINGGSLPGPKEGYHHA